MLLPPPARPSDFAPPTSASPFVEIALDSIDDGDRLRPVEPAWVSALAAEIEAGSELPPIIVRLPEPSEGGKREFRLVAGGHRLAAYRVLGRSHIRAEIRHISRLEARLVEIEENLVRHELNALDRAVFLAEHKRVWAELHPDSAHGGDRKSRKNKDKIKSQTLGLDPRRFTVEAAKLCNLSEATVQAAIALVTALTPETIIALRGTETARNAAELKRLADEPAERQILIAKALRDGQAPNVAAARIAAGVAPAGEGDPQEAAFRGLVSNWARADRKSRARFLQHAGLVEERGTRSPPQRPRRGA